MSTPARIVVLGSINMDLVIRCGNLPAAGQTVIAIDSAEIPGGKGANQAVAAARAGGQVQMIGRVGVDAFADRLMDNLHRESIGIDAVQTTADTASGIAVVAVEQSGENSIMVVSGANAAVTPDDVTAQQALIRGADVLLLQLEIPLPSVLAAIGIAKAAGVPVILDPAPMPDQLADDFLRVDVICPNQSEAAALVGHPVDTIDQARQAIRTLHQRGAVGAIITMAAQGALVSDGQRIELIEPLPITAVDSTAAGDAFAGALAVRMAEGASLWDAAKFATIAGGLAATRHGAQPALPRRDEIAGYPLLGASYPHN